MPLRSKLLALTLALTLMGCATPTPPASLESDSARNEGLSAELLFQIMAAEVAAQRGEPGAAFATLLAAARQSGEARLARRATELAIANRALPQALEAAQLWHSLAPELDEAAHTLGALLIANQRTDEAEPIYAPWVAKDPAKHLLQAQRAIHNTQERKAAFDLLVRLAQPTLQDTNPQSAPLRAQVHLIVASGALAAQQPERAATHVRAAYALRPDDEQIASAAAQFLAGTNPADPAAAPGRKQALALLESFLNTHPQADSARVRYARLLLADQQRAAAVREFELVLAHQSEHLEALYTLSLLTAQTPPHTQARHYTQRYLDALARQPQAGHDSASAYLHMARLAEDERRHDEALGWVRKVSTGPQAFAARLQEALLLARVRRIDEARKLLTGLTPSNDEEQLQITLTDAAVLREAGRHRDAYAVLSAALARNPDEPALLYDTAMAAERLNRLEAVETHLKRLIELHPDHAHAHNALGYTWAERNVRLPEAQQLIDRALELAPDDAAILDSAGWVRFRLGQLTAARPYLERAFALRPDAEVGAHLGEVLWRLGEHEAARAIFRQVRTLDPTHEALRQTLRRLKVKL